MKLAIFVGGILFVVPLGCTNVASRAPAGAASSPATDTTDAEPWPGWVRIQQERALSILRNCPGRPEYWALEVDDAGRVRPRKAMPPLDGRWEALPVEALPEELARPVVTSADRTVIEGPTAWLVALHAGEFGGGLYSVSKRSRQSVRLDALLPEAVRSIQELDFGILAVAGLCHGEGCSLTTHLYRVERVHRAPEWTLVPLAELSGCPVGMTRSARSEALLLTRNAVHSVSSSGVAVLGSWPDAYAPVHASDAVARDVTGSIYVSFGRVVARFTQGILRERWAPREHSSCGAQ